MNFIHLKTVDSTNNYALELLQNAAANGGAGVQSLNKTVIVADEQTAGRGRINRNFYSPANTGAYFTAIYAPPAAIEEVAKLTVAAAVAVCRTLEKIFSVEPKIKWVNDVYVNQKKVCGILAEGHINSATQKIDAAVIGIGINIFTQNFPTEISNKAGAVLESLPLSKNGQFDAAKIDSIKKSLVQEVCENLFSFYKFSNDTGVPRPSTSNDFSMPKSIESPLGKDTTASKPFCFTNSSVTEQSLDVFSNSAAKMPSGFSSIIAEYKRRSFLIGRRVKVIPVIGQAESYFADVVDIDDAARLVVRTQGGEERRLESGEVSLEL